MTARARRITLATAIGLLYVLTGKVGLDLAFLHASATPVWPPAGIALAALLILGIRIWPIFFVGAFLINISTAGSVATSLAIALGNTLEAVLGAALVNRFAGGRDALDRVRNIFLFVLLAGFLSTTVSATIGVTSLALGGFARWSDYGSIWLTWWLGDAAGDLIVAPLHPPLEPAAQPGRAPSAVGRGTAAGCDGDRGGPPCLRRHPAGPMRNHAHRLPLPSLAALDGGPLRPARGGAAAITMLLRDRSLGHRPRRRPVRGRPRQRVASPAAGVHGHARSDDAAGGGRRDEPAPRGDGRPREREGFAPGPSRPAGWARGNGRWPAAA